MSLSLLLVCWWLFHCYFFSYLFLHFYCYRRYNQSSCSSITELFVMLIHVNDLSSSRSAVLVSFLKSNLSYLTFRLQNNLGKKYGTHPVLLSYFTHRYPSVESNCFVWTVLQIFVHCMQPVMTAIGWCYITVLRDLLIHCLVNATSIRETVCLSYVSFCLRVFHFCCFYGRRCDLLFTGTKSLH